MGKGQRRQQSGTSGHGLLGRVLVLITLLALPSAALAAPDALRWSGKGFARDGDAIEHVTIRGTDSAGRAIFLRYSLANAAFRDGSLEITARIATSAGAIKGKATYKRGHYSIRGDGFGITAGQNTIRAEGDTLHIHIEISGHIADATLKLRGTPVHVSSRGKDGLIERDLLSPWGKLDLQATLRGGKTGTLKATVFAVHEASTCSAHRIYDRCVQVHTSTPGQTTLVDYIVMPPERGSKPLGFVALRGNGLAFSGAVQSETRGDTRRDGKTGYQVPYAVQIVAARGARVAKVLLGATRQLSRKDDLASLPYLARKAVALLFKPFTFTLDGTFLGSVAGEAATLDGKVKWRYAQTR